MTKRTSNLDVLDAYFRARPGQWIDGRHLATIAGAYAWRSRVSNLRTERGMTVDNRIRRLQNAAGQTYVVSEYRFDPPPAPASPLGELWT